MTSEQVFHARLRINSDITDHLCTLRLLALNCDHITEFGVRTGNSTVAFLAGLRPSAKLVSYDLNKPEFIAPDDLADRWTFHQANTGELPQIAVTDMLFIDTLHTYDQVRKELKHGNQARKWLVFHDTVLFGAYGELGQRGINDAISEFLTANPHWKIFASCLHNNGLLILERE